MSTDRLRDFLNVLVSKHVHYKFRIIYIQSR